MSIPLVSVVMPVYNEEKYILFAIESVLAQTFEDFELVVVDNASLDGTRSIVRNCKDPRVRLVEQQRNVSLAENFNLAFAQARGQYIKLLPGDDVLYPTCLERQVAILSDPAWKSVVLVSCTRDVISENGQKVYRPSPYFIGQVPGKLAVPCSLRFGANLIGEPVSILLRKSALAQVGWCDDSLPFVIDMDLWFRLLLLGDLYFIPEPLAAFRISRHSLSFSMLGKQTRHFFQFIDKVQRNPNYQIRFWDAMIGRSNALLREIVRWGAYTWYLSK